MTPRHFREERALASQHSLEHLIAVNRFDYNKEEAEKSMLKRDSSQLFIPTEDLLF